MAFILSLLIVLFVNLLFNIFEKINISGNIKEDNVYTNEISNFIKIENSQIENIILESVIPKEEVWNIEIPKINLNTKISEDVTQEVLNKYVGHFPETKKMQGNVGLAAHNRGYDVNYFENVKYLEIGDLIIYKYNEFEKNYKVDLITIIKDTDWKYLENTNENKITLITCLEDMPEYRRCIQATEIQ